MRERSREPGREASASASSNLGKTCFLAPPQPVSERVSNCFEPSCRQVTIIGFVGKAPEVKFLPNATPVVKFSVATKKSWKDDQGAWKDKTQWHNVVAFGPGFQHLADRLSKGVQVVVQGELNTRAYDRTIKVPNGKKSIDHVIQYVVELKADTIRLLDRNNGNACADDAEEQNTEEAPD